MKTIADVIRLSRARKKYSLDSLEAETKIRKEFLSALEKSAWNKLPEYTTVVGFVKTICSRLGINEEAGLAMLRRDYPPNLKDKKQPKKLFRGIGLEIGPKLFSIGAITLIIITFLGYIIFQYISFARPPKLVIETPLENQEITVGPFLIKGKTDKDASIFVNNQPAYVEENGNFSTEIEISKKTSTLEFKAVTRAGKETKVVRNIIPK